MRNFPLNGIAGLLGIESEGLAQVAGYQIDSRRIEPGDLFFALKGERTDGHSFLKDVAARGGIAAVVSSEYRGPDEGLVLLPVDDVLMSLQALARHFVRESKAKIVGITGSMGKTTTKDFIATLLEGKFRVGKTYSSYNTRLTLPITVLNMVGNEEILVLEMGMGEAGDIAKLVEIAPPDVAVLTKVGLAHYGALFPTVADIAKAKGEIFSHPKTKKAIFYHGFSEVPIFCEKVTFSLSDRDADYVFSGDFMDERGVRATRFDLPFPQPHVRYNFLCAVAVARSFGMEWDDIAAQIPKLALPKMRFQQFEKEGILFINDAYNANPESTMAALSCLPEPKSGGKRIAVLGRMIDLGPFSKSSHEEVGRFARDIADHLLTYAPEALPLYEAFSEGRKPAEHFLDFGALTARLKELMRPGDVVLVKGSRDLQMERIFEQI
jgi:UDP-N-acetylmuramoyl-tripeptide--D-alanyl-D-alanine ligase